MLVGFIGLGVMGSRMAANLAKHGYPLIVWNRTPAKADSLVKAGARLAASSAEVGQNADILFTMLTTPQSVEQMALGENGFLAHMQGGKLWVDCSTVNPSFTKQMASEAKKLNIRFLDAPVAGSKGPAEQGQLLIYVGGEEKDLQEVRPLLQVMGKAIIHVGQNGMGCALKMVNNILLAQSMLAFSEALILGEALGISRKMMLDVLLTGPVAAPFLAGKRSRLENEDFDTDFALQWMKKDLQLAALSAYEQGVAIPTTNVAKEIYQLATQAGMGEMDFSSIFAFLKQNKAQGSE